MLHVSIASWKLEFAVARIEICERHRSHGLSLDHIMFPRTPAAQFTSHETKHVCMHDSTTYFWIASSHKLLDSLGLECSMIRMIVAMPRSIT